MLGQIDAAPPDQFLRLASLDPTTYASLRTSLDQVPGLVVRKVPERLFQAEATGLVGEVGSEINPVLRADGAFYLPGTTVGLSGLEQAYQRQLLGTPTTEVVAVNSAGTQTGVLARWPGVAGTPVRTTISSSVQNAALAALDSVSEFGRDRRRPGVHRRGPGGGPAPRVRRASGRRPADRQAGAGHGVHHRVGRRAAGRPGMTASTSDALRELLHRRRADFHQRRDRRDRSRSATISPTTAARRSRGFRTPHAGPVRPGGEGLRDRRRLVRTCRCPPSPGRSRPRRPGRDLAAQTIGQGNVQMSPLAMAMVAAAVDSGSWHTPQFVEGAGRSGRNRGRPGSQ